MSAPSTSRVPARVIAERDERGYREIAPPAALAPWVECFWTSRGSRPEFDVLPDGCVDLLFGASTPGDGVLAGAMTRPLRVAAQPAADLCAVRFRPGGAFAFVGADLRDFTDRTVELDAIAGELRSLRRFVWRDERTDGRVAALCDWLLQRAPARPDGVLAALRVLADAPSAFRVERAADAAGASRQTFARRVAERTGLPPKLLARVVRTRAAVAAIGTAPLAAVAHDHGFSDQAHLARELRSLTGRTAGELLRGTAHHSFKTDGAAAGTLQP